MSHGNTSNKSGLDKANEFLGRLMGKRATNDNSPKIPPQKTSPKKNDVMFVGALSIAGVVIWLLTGICYVPDDYYGAISQNGKVVKVLPENSFYLSYPYPISDFNVFNLEGSKISIEGTESGNDFISTTADNKLVKFSYSFNIAIQNPTLFYNNFYQDNKNSLNRIKLIAEDNLLSYLNQHDYLTLSEQNKIILANEIAARINSQINQYGLEVSKANLTNFALIDVTPQQTSIESNIVDTQLSPIEQQAELYKANQDKQINNMQNDYYALLKQYKANPPIVAELMYYRTIANIGTNANTIESYPLLSLSESEFLSGYTSASGIKQDGVRNIRSVNRNVVRERVLDDSN
jgi:regulator of protease activity HflC (stomatin/prohibitin superfamily)